MGTVKIAYAAQVPVPSHRAHGVHVMRMCEAYAGLGHDTVLYAMPASEAGEPHAFYGTAPRFEVVSVPMRQVRGISGPLFGRAIARTAADRGADLFHSRHIWAALFAQTRGLQVVFEAHQPMETALHKALLRRLLARGAGFVVITEALKRRYMADFALESARITVAHDAAVLPTQIPKTPEGPFTVGYVGNLYPGKGMEVMLEIARLMPDTPFEIVGGRSEDLASWRSLGIPANMQLRGQVPHGALQAYFDRMSVLLLPLQHRVSPDGGGADIAAWTSPMKMFEYMAQGRPIVASDLPVLGEVLRDGETALIAPAAAPEAWVDAITRLRMNPALASRLGAAGRAKLEADHTWAARAAEIIDRFRKKDAGL